jgi:hypothetical protein
MVYVGHGGLAGLAGEEVAGFLGLARAGAVGYLPRAGTLGLPAAQRIEQVVVQDDA